MTDNAASFPRPEAAAPVVLWVVPLLCAVLIPGLWWTTADWPFAFRPDLIGTMTLFVAITAVAVLAAISRGFQRRIRWSLGVTTALIISGFQWRQFTAAGESVAETVGFAPVADVLPVAVAAALLWLAVRLAGALFFAVTTGTALVAAVVVLAFNAFALAAPAPAPVTDATPRPDSPDVLLLVLDGYARSDWLATEYGFDNDPFLDALEDRGFVVASAATPNYSYTYASVATMLNLDYIFAPGEITDPQRKEMRAALTGAAGMVPTLKAAGYEITQIENAWGGSQCGSAIDRCIRDGLLDRSLWNLGQMTILAPVFSSVARDPFNALSVAHLNSLGDWIAESSANGKPRFTFAHLLLPHEPMHLNDDCSEGGRSDLTRWGEGDMDASNARRRNYTEQISCVNDRVLNIVDTFVTAQPDGIVMITGDHGPGSTLDADLTVDRIADYTVAERMKILSAYRLPGCLTDFHAAITPVNGARLVTSCATNSALPPLPDRNYWSDVDSEGLVTDLTSRVQG